MKIGSYRLRMPMRKSELAAGIQLRSEIARKWKGHVVFSWTLTVSSSPPGQSR